MLDKEPRLQVVGDTGSSTEAVRLATELRPDVLLLDHSMPDRPGSEVVPLVADAAPDVDVVVFSGAPPSGDPPDGVLAWLTKGEPMNDTIERLLTVLDQRRGHRP